MITENYEYIAIVQKKAIDKILLYSHDSRRRSYIIDSTSKTKKKKTQLCNRQYKTKKNHWGFQSDPRYNLYQR